MRMVTLNMDLSIQIRFAIGEAFRTGTHKAMILEYLNQHIIAQDEAKKEVALAMYYHSLKSKYIHNQEIGTNGVIMLVGPTGSGKTFIVQKACEYVNTLFLL